MEYQFLEPPKKGESSFREIENNLSERNQEETIVAPDPAARFEKSSFHYVYITCNSYRFLIQHI